MLSSFNSISQSHRLGDGVSVGVGETDHDLIHLHLPLQLSSLAQEFNPRLSFPGAIDLDILPADLLRPAFPESFKDRFLDRETGRVMLGGILLRGAVSDLFRQEDPPQEGLAVLPQQFLDPLDLNNVYSYSQNSHKSSSPLRSGNNHLF